MKVDLNVPSFWILANGKPGHLPRESRERPIEISIVRCRGLADFSKGGFEVDLEEVTGPGGSLAERSSPVMRLIGVLPVA